MGKNIVAPLLLCLIGALLLSGCSRRAPPVARPPANLAAPAAPDQDLALASAGMEGLAPGETRPGVYQGKTVAQWGEMLKSSNAGRREQASEALRLLGEAGYPPLRDALNDPTPEVRLKAMQALDLPLLRIHAEEMVPLLLALLVNDSNPAVREQAAMRLVAFDSITADGKLRAGTQANQRLQALQHAARTDPAPNVRLAAANSIQCIQSALSGRVNAD